MSRETLQTIFGLCIIVIIVTATFLYGNAQRQSQLKRDQNLTSQQTTSPAASSAVSNSSNASSGPNTAPVSSPSANTIQGSKASGTSVPAVAAATPTPAGTPIPDTGGGWIGVIGLGSVAVLALTWIKSRRAVLAAIRVRS